jgi:hypothetical protein
MWMFRGRANVYCAARAQPLLDTARLLYSCPRRYDAYDLEDDLAHAGASHTTLMLTLTARNHLHAF